MAEGFDHAPDDEPSAILPEVRAPIRRISLSERIGGILDSVFNKDKERREEDDEEKKKSGRLRRIFGWLMPNLVATDSIDDNLEPNTHANSRGSLFSSVDFVPVGAEQNLDHVPATDLKPGGSEIDTKTIAEKSKKSILQRREVGINEATDGSYIESTTDKVSDNDVEDTTLISVSDPEQSDSMSVEQELFVRGEEPRLQQDPVLYIRGMSAYDRHRLEQNQRQNRALRAQTSELKSTSENTEKKLHKIERNARAAGIVGTAVAHAEGTSVQIVAAESAKFAENAVEQAKQPRSIAESVRSSDKIFENNKAVAGEALILKASKKEQINSESQSGRRNSENPITIQEKYIERYQTSEPAPESLQELEAEDPKELAYEMSHEHKDLDKQQVQAWGILQEQAAVTAISNARAIAAASAGAQKSMTVGSDGATKMAPTGTHSKINQTAINVGFVSVVVIIAIIIVILLAQLN